MLIFSATDEGQKAYPEQNDIIVSTASYYERVQIPVLVCTRTMSRKKAKHLDTLSKAQKASASSFSVSNASRNVLQPRVLTALNCCSACCPEPPDAAAEVLPGAAPEDAEPTAADADARPAEDATVGPSRPLTLEPLPQLDAALRLGRRGCPRVNTYTQCLPPDDKLLRAQESTGKYSYYIRNYILGILVYIKYGKG